MKYYIVTIRGQIFIESTNLDLCWSICETASRCGNNLTVISKHDFESRNGGKVNDSR